MVLIYKAHKGYLNLSMYFSTHLYQKLCVLHTVLKTNDDGMFHTHQSQSKFKGTRI